MAAPLRRLIAGIPFYLIFLLPLAAALVFGLRPAFQGEGWAALLTDPRLIKATIVTVLSAGLSTVIALALAIFIVMLGSQNFGSGETWRGMRNALPAFLSLPHLAFAVGFAFLIAPSGWIARAIGLFAGWDAPPLGWVPPRDQWGLSLALGLSLKETPFLLWMVLARLSRSGLGRQAMVAATMGYGPARIWLRIILPQLLPRLALPLAAVLAYGLTVVDVALILGPTTPPPLAVLVWEWLRDPAGQGDALAAGGSVILIGLFAGLCLVATGLWRAIKPVMLAGGGGRRGRHSLPGARIAPLLLALPFVAATAMLLAWSISAGWFWPDLLPNGISLRGWTLRSEVWGAAEQTLLLGALSTAIAMAAAVLWLETRPKPSLAETALIYLPLLAPATLVAAGQYEVVLRLGLTGNAGAVVVAHIAYVLPYLMIALAANYRAFDRRYWAVSASLGRGYGAFLLRVKWPMLTKPLAYSAAIGFSVSVAQYLTTQIVGAGLVPTLTTEAVTLSAGGNRRLLAVHALLQAALPLFIFALAALIGMRKPKTEIGG